MAEFRKITDVEVVENVNVDDTFLIERDGTLKRAPQEAIIPTSVPQIQTTSVGQTVVVKAVDENGKPTEWEAKDMGGGGVTWIFLGEDNVYIDEEQSVPLTTSIFKQMYENGPVRTRLHSNFGYHYGTVIGYSINGATVEAKLCLGHNNQISEREWALES